MEFEIGQLVRVSIEKDRSCRATISTINEGSNSVDVVYDDPEWTCGKEEESEVMIDRVRSLYSFERMDDQHVGSSSTASSIREEGNQLFRIGDYGCAIATYRQANQSIVAPIQIGK
jgi:hypothetical protein